MTVQPKLKELLGRVSSRHSTDAEIWQQYALLYGNGHSSNSEDNEKVGTMSNTPATGVHYQYLFDMFHTATHSQPHTLDILNLHLF